MIRQVERFSAARPLGQEIGSLERNVIELALIPIINNRAKIASAVPLLQIVHGLTDILQGQADVASASIHHGAVLRFDTGQVIRGSRWFENTMRIAVHGGIDILESAQQLVALSDVKPELLPSNPLEPRDISGIIEITSRARQFEVNKGRKGREIVSSRRDQAPDAGIAIVNLRSGGVRVFERREAGDRVDYLEITMIDPRYQEVLAKHYEDLVANFRTIHRSLHPEINQDFW